MEPPQCRFVTKINMTCVNGKTGAVEPAKCELLRVWKPENTIETILTTLRKEMQTPANKKLSQPPEGANF